MVVWRGCCGCSQSAVFTGRPIVPPSPDAARPRVLFVTGKLAEPALRRLLADLAPRAGFEPVVAVLPITVAALTTTPWVARHLPMRSASSYPASAAAKPHRSTRYSAGSCQTA